MRGLQFLLALLAVTAAITPAKAQRFDVSADAKAMIVEQTNAYRQGKGLPPLSESVAASRVAQAYAAFLAETNKTGHRADGRDPVQRLRAAGVKFCKFYGENWHESWTRPQRPSVPQAVGKAMRFWKTSPGHERALRSASTEIGVGVAGWKHGDRWYYQEIQMFLDTSCLKPTNAAKSAEDSFPPLPDRNPERLP